MARDRIYAIRYKNGETELAFGNWFNIQEKVIGAPGVTYKGFDILKDAQAWLAQKPIPFRKAEDPLEKDKLYLFVDGSYSPDLKLAGWGWVAVINDKSIDEDFGVVIDENLLTSRNIAGELNAAMKVADWYVQDVNLQYGKPIIVHDYSGIGNWALGYWDAHKDVSIAYQHHMAQYEGLFDFEKVDGHTGHKWNDYADKLASEGYSSEKIRN